MPEPLAGVFPVLPTPFHAGGDVDPRGLASIVEHCAAAGADGVVYPANASEVQALTVPERELLVDAVFDAAGRLPVVVGLTGADRATAPRLVAQAERRGAAAVIVMPPGGEPGAIAGHLEATLGECAVPVMFQNAPAPLGPGLAPEDVAAIVAATPSVRYLKEETMPSAQRIARLHAGRPPHVLGIFGGDGGRSVMAELRQGADGFMPAADLVEQHVELLRRWRAGDLDGAYAVFEAILPLLNLQRVYRWAVTKRVLRRRGFIAGDAVRMPGAPSLDAVDDDELRRFWARATRAAGAPS